MLSLLFLLARNYQAEMRLIVYGSKGMFGPTVFCVTAATMLLAATGAAMGANSAGQKRNHLTKRSWIAFFVGSATLSVTIILFAIFWFNHLALK